MIVLVTGGTGSLGRVLVPMLFRMLPDVERVRVLSRDEHKQALLKPQMGDKVDFFLGDVRDRDRVCLASRGCDAVFHLAAFKSVDLAEYNPREAYRINVEGTENVAYACRENDIPKAIFTSTDKAVNPHNIYGATKAMAEAMWVQSNCYSGSDGPRLSAVRYGNVFGSNGSVIQKWKSGPVKVTDPEMTRFFISIEKAAEFVIQSFKEMDRGEVFIPPMRSIELGALAKHFTEDFEVIGTRPGEKIHEDLISRHEAHLVRWRANKFVRLPAYNLFQHDRSGEPLSSKWAEGLNSYNADRLTKKEIQCLLQSLPT